ncbi:MAG: carboxypeptidase M32, partial [Gemmataceae bacterium]
MVYTSVLAHHREIALWNSCSAVLQWDQQTMMPRRGAALRGDQIALLAQRVHALATAPQLGEWLQSCQPENPLQAANLAEYRRAYNRATKIPARLVEELARVTTQAHEDWAAARAESDFARFQPALEQIVKLKQEEAQAVGVPRGGELYDALLDEFEPGCSAETVADIFRELGRRMVPLLRQIQASGRTPRRELLTQEFPIDRQKLFAEGIAAAIGFDFRSGRLDTATHPFCSGFGPGDCRITTRYNPRHFNDAFFGVLHEAGHGLYEQNLP